MIKKTNIRIFLFLIYMNANAQEAGLKFEHITIDDGLASNTVNSVCKDSRGFMWIATENGLSRYDGYTFKNFRSNERDSNSIKSNITFVVSEDSQNRIWVGTQKGLHRLNRSLDRFDVNYFADTTVRAIFEDKKKRLWIGTSGGLFLFNEATQSFSKPFPHLFATTNLPNNNISSIAEDSASNLWIGTRLDGIYVCNYKTKAVAHFTSTNSASLNSNSIRYILNDSKNRIWIATYGGGLNLYEHNRFFTYKNNPADLKSLSNDLTTSLMEDHKGRIWIGTAGSGLDILDPENHSFFHTANSISNPRGLNNNVIRVIYNDRSGSVWIGTYSGGINFHNESTNSFSHYTIPTFNQNNNVTSFAEDHHGNLWIGTDGGGLCYFDRSKGVFTNYFHEKHDNFLSTNCIISLAIDHFNIVWIGTYSGGLCSYNPATKSFRIYKTNDGSLLAHNTIWSTYVDRKNRLWVGTYEGLQLFDRKANLFKSYTHANSGLSNDIVRAIYEDSNNRLWIGTENGLNLLQETTGTFKIWNTENGGSKSLSNSWILCMNEDDQGNLVVGTVEGGLNILNLKKNTVEKVTEKDGLISNMICGILRGEGKMLWISTDKGLSRLNVSDNSIRNFLAKDGLQNNKFIVNAYLKTRGKELLFGGINGFTLFKPEYITYNELMPKLAFTGFKIFNKDIPVTPQSEILKSHITEAKEITLDYKHSVITFEFSVLNFIQPEKNEYAYRLLGFEKDWNYVGNKKSATYTNLAPGTYRFQVKGCNNNKIWNHKGISIHLEVIPPFWDTWWFKILIGIVLMLSLLLLACIYRRWLMNKAKINNLILKLKNKAVIAQMNPHFTFNCINSIQELILINKQDDAMLYLHKFSLLLREVLECSEKNIIPLEREITLLNLYLELESMRFDNKFRYEIIIHPELDPEEIYIPTFLIQPCVENAIWHGLLHKNGERLLKMNFYLDEHDQILICKISDNGIGRAAASRNKKNNRQFGLRLITERIALIKAKNINVSLRIVDEKDREGNACGTTVYITIPEMDPDQSLLTEDSKFNDNPL